MTSLRAPTSLLLLFLAASLTLGCGSSGMSNRQLQSMTINGLGLMNCCEVGFFATGSYSAPPSTVSPAPAFWFVGNPPADYQLTTQPFVVSCSGPLVVVTAMAPADPNAPSSGPIASTRMIVATTTPPCPNVE